MAILDLKIGRPPTVLDIEMLGDPVCLDGTIRSSAPAPEATPAERPREPVWPAESSPTWPAPEPLSPARSMPTASVPLPRVSRSSRPAPRPGPLRFFAWLSMATWGLIVIAIGFIAAAQPPTQLGFFSRVGSGMVRSYWDRGDLGIALALSGVAWSLALGGLVAHQQLHRNIPKGLVAGCCAASLILLGCLLQLA